MGFWTKAILNREEYKGFLKLFLQRNNYAPVVCLLAFALIFAAVTPAEAIFVAFDGRTYNVDSGTPIRNIGQDSQISFTGQSGVFGMSYFPEKSKLPAGTDTKFAVIGPNDSGTRFVMSIFGDTMAIVQASGSNPNDTVLIAGTALFDTVFLTTDTGGTNDTLSYVLSVVNYANTFDTIGMIVDTAWFGGATTDTTTGRFSYQFFNRNGVALTGVLTTAHEDTAKVGMAADTKGDTLILRIYTKGTVNADTVRVAVRAFANNATGRFRGTTGKEAAPYTGFNNIKYGGSGNAATYIEVTVSGPLIRLAALDTVFAPVSLGGASGAAADDTQHYVPGAMMVYTLWFDNDGTDTTDTIVVENWIDTRHLRFDSAGLSQLIGVPQIAAAETYVTNRYGNIFLDSAMPNVGAGFKVEIQYSAGGDSMAGLNAATPLESVGRIRWIITRDIAGTRGVVGATNGDDGLNIDAAPLAPKAGTDVDMGYVRYAVTIR